MTVYTYTSFFYAKRDLKGGVKADNFNDYKQFNVKVK